MSGLDDLLSELKAEYKDTEEPQRVTKPPAVPTKPSSPQSSTSSIDNLLDQVKKEGKENKPQPTPPPQKISSHSRFTPTIEPSLFQELRSEYHEKDQQEIKQKQRLEEQRQQKKREALREKAQNWLKQLNPKSDEGKWFEEFSYSYDSKIEAAMNYLEALKESGMNI